MYALHPNTLHDVQPPRPIRLVQLDHIAAGVADQREEEPAPGYVFAVHDRELPANPLVRLEERDDAPFPARPPLRIRHLEHLGVVIPARLREPLPVALADRRDGDLVPDPHLADRDRLAVPADETRQPALVLEDLLRFPATQRLDHEPTHGRIDDL